MQSTQALHDADAEECRATLLEALEVVAAQRARIGELQEQLAQAEGARDELQLELGRERRAREAAEAGLRGSAGDFARRLSAMQARVLEAERDVVLGGQLLVTRSAPPTGGGEAGGSGGGLGLARAGEAAGGAGSGREAPANDDAASFTQPRVLRPPAGQKLAPGSVTPRRAHSLSQRLEPLPPCTPREIAPLKR